MVDFGWSLDSKAVGNCGHLRGLDALTPREGGVDLARQQLEVAVGLGSLRLAKDTDCPARDPVVSRVLVREIVVLPDRVLLHGVRLGVLLVVVVIPASAPVAAATAVAAAVVADLVELPAVLGCVTMPIVIDIEGTVVHLDLLK